MLARTRAEKPLPSSGWIEVEQAGYRWRLCMDAPQGYTTIDHQIACHGVFEAQSTKLVSELVKPGMYVLDVGANIGYFTVQFARLVGKEGRVIAFEPTEIYGERLRWHLEANKLNNVQVEKLALSDQEGELDISIGVDSATMHWCADYEPRKREHIRTVALDSWWSHYLRQGHPDRLNFVKVDIDGHEPKFLQGAEKTLRKHRPILLMEFMQEALHAFGCSAWGLATQVECLGYILCDETTGQPFKNRTDFLKKAANFAFSANVLCRPK